jgi:hypothetical protein
MKLLNELRVREVNSLNDEQEGQGSKFSEGDIIFYDGDIYKRNATAYDDANPTGSWTQLNSGSGVSDFVSLSDTPGSLSADMVIMTNGTADALVEFNAGLHGLRDWTQDWGPSGYSIPVTNIPSMVGSSGGNPGSKGLVPAPGAAAGTYFLRGDGTWAASGGGSSISLGNSEVTVTDAGSDGNIALQTEGTVRWNITSSGHILPSTNEDYDVGSAEKKVRHLFLSDNSLWVGDQGKISIKDDQIKIIKRRKSRWPSKLVFTGANLDYLNNTYGYSFVNESDDYSLVTLDQWEAVAKNSGLSFDDLYDPSDELDWEPAINNDNDIRKITKVATEITRTFYVAVDNKDSNRYPEAGGSTDAFYIDGYHTPELKLKKGKYRFFQKHASNSGHPITFKADNEDPSGSAAEDGLAELNVLLKYGYVDEGNSNNEVTNSTWTGTQWDPGGNKVGTPYGDGLSNSFSNNPLWKYFVDITIQEDTPKEFYYVCNSHEKMGWKIVVEDAHSGSIDKTDVLDAMPDFSGGDTTINVALELENKMGGRIIIAGNDANDVVAIDLNTLLQNSFDKTFNFEIQSEGTHDIDDAFSFKVYNSSGSQLVLQSFHQNNVIVDANTTAPNGLALDVAGNQMLVIWCDGDTTASSCGWKYQLRTV